MIARYPDFSKLTISDKPELEAYTAPFAPYSDFNFISLYSWDTDGSLGVSDLNGNLVVRLPDYLTALPRYSVLGGHVADDSLETLLRDVGQLDLVPLPVIEQVRQPERFITKETRDEFDYVYSLKDLAELPTDIYQDKAKKARRFTRHYESKYRIAETVYGDETTIRLINYIFDWWQHVKDRQEDDTDQERKAIDRITSEPGKFNLATHTLTVEGVPAGFSIHEILDNGYAISHFHKTLPVYKNADVFFNQRVAQALLRYGSKYVNWEQDLGLPGLRQSKMAYHPVGYLKKYSLRLAAPTS